MLDLRRSAVWLTSARALLVASLAILCAWVAPSAHAATGDLRQIVDGGFGPTQLGLAGPVAVGPDGNLFVADLPGGVARLREFSSTTGEVLATATVDTSNPSGSSLIIAALAVDVEN